MDLEARFTNRMAWGEVFDKREAKTALKALSKIVSFNLNQENT